MPRTKQFHPLTKRRLPLDCGLAVSLALVLLVGCDSAPVVDTDPSSPIVELESSAPTVDAVVQLATALAAQPDEARARYDARHPQETLEFFGVKPGMTVVEADPGSGWYSKILQSYLGNEGTLIGADYPMGIYRLFDYYSEEELAAKTDWPVTWPQSMTQNIDGGAVVKAYAFGSLPAEWEGTVDVFLLVRTLHNFADFEEEGAYLSEGLDEVYRVLKPGGIVGIVQHAAPESAADSWASGANGYLKQSFVIATLESAGFLFDGESAINENPADQPTEEESVWRLAPTLEPVKDPELAAAYVAIGESNRMTLRFRKPR
ncbi:methyltransferase [Congregibacter brevis]|uniref:Methyltransferase n=1 Tax=Congregibacter brevis TaxID=3081201 RepID=A0ABZ0I9G7_9GAMM|nr:methyltransferase [Congregibacter sp. IMCC45268]